MIDDEVIDTILANEGGYVDRPSDPGGRTIYGLTLADQTEILGHEPTEAETRAFPIALAREFYRKVYVTPFQFILHEPLRVLVTDTGVLFGIPWTITLLQELTGCATDGALGPITRMAVLSALPKELMKRIVHRRQLRAIRTALSDVPADLIPKTRLEDLEGWWARTWKIGVQPL